MQTALLLYHAVFVSPKTKKAVTIGNLRQQRLY